MTLKLFRLCEERSDAAIQCHRPQSGLLRFARKDEGSLACRRDLILRRLRLQLDIIGDAHLLDEFELRFEDIHMLLLVF